MALAIDAKIKLTLQHLLYIMLHRANASKIFCVPHFKGEKVFKLH